MVSDAFTSSGLKEHEGLRQREMQRAFATWRSLTLTLVGHEADCAVEKSGHKVGECAIDSCTARDTNPYTLRFSLCSGDQVLFSCLSARRCTLRSVHSHRQRSPIHQAVPRLEATWQC